MEDTADAKLTKKERHDVLAALLDRVERHLRYAETKNGVLLTLNLATIGLSLRLGHNECSIILTIVWGLGVFSCLAAIIIVLSSFVPKLKGWYEKIFNAKSIEKENHLITNGRNILYFEHISEIGAGEYEDFVLCELGVSPECASRFEKDLIKQIHVNSTITLRKFKVFTPAVIFFGLGLVLTLIGNS